MPNKRPTTPGQGETRSVRGRQALRFRLSPSDSKRLEGYSEELAHKLGRPVSRGVAAREPLVDALRARSQVPVDVRRVKSALGALHEFASRKRSLGPAEIASLDRIMDARDRLHLREGLAPGKTASAR